MKRSTRFFLAFIIFAVLILSACNGDSNGSISASGTLSAVDVAISPMISGQIAEIVAFEGDTVETGDVLFRINDELVSAQRDQTQAAVDAAQATLQAAQAQLTYAQTQRDLVVQGARLQDLQSRQQAWSITVPTDYQPAWYFQAAEMITAAHAEVDAAQQALTDEQAALTAEVENVNNQDFIAAEARLAQAQIGLSVAQVTMQQANLSRDTTLVTAAQDNLDTAQTEMDAALQDYNRMLTTTAADSVLEARARVAVAQSRLDNAQDALMALQTGDQSLQVTAADAAVQQAEAAVAQAEGNLAQAQAALALVEVQLSYTEVTAPMDGLVLTSDLQVGEIAAAGGTVMTIGQLQDMDLIVYISEDQYGQVTVGERVNVQVDSFPGEVFSGSVVRIADEAEFTPRNVQTADGRSSTVYAVEISVPNSTGQLRPGMPADVTFIPGE
ncbi:MAG TPA: efflux RND transporter periplasmic adaptor subunit [Longilinea sp.]|nr:efflux RND transporter periplasmic adaptor subunit [Longilinea sp.]